MDKVEKQQQENESVPQISQNQLKQNPFPELANHSSKQAPVFHDFNDKRQQVIKDAQVEKQIEDNVQLKTQKPEQLGEQVIQNGNNEVDSPQKIQKQPLQNKDEIIDGKIRVIQNNGKEIIEESNYYQQRQIKNIAIQNEYTLQKPIDSVITPQVQQLKQAQSNQPQQINQYTQRLEYIEKQSKQMEEKQKIRLNTQLIESSFNDKQKPVVQFEQYNQSIINNHQQSFPLTINQPQLQSKNNQELQQLQKSNQDQQQFLSLNVQPYFHKSVQNSPRKEGAGKIARKKLHEKGIYNALINLQKRDKHQKQIYELAQKRQQSTTKIDLSKLQTNITLNSNVLNVTVIEPKQQKTQQQKLLSQVQQLRKKLLHLQISKNKQKEDSITSNKSISALYKNQEHIHLQNLSHQESSEGDYYISSKHDRRRNIGKFYRLVENNNAKISEELRILGFRDKNQFQKQTLSARKPKANNFRVRKNNKSNYLSSQKDYSIKQIPQNDECFQIKREATEKLLFDEEDKLNFIQKPTPRNLVFQQNFKQYIQSFFIPNINQKPFQDDSEIQLIQLAKNTFNKFGVNIKQEKSKVLHIRKYKNCVSFILNSQYTIIWHYQGRFYLGGWQIDQNGDGHKVGWGYENSPNKFTYSGQFKDNKRDGYGMMKIYSKKNEIIYEGQWKQGAKHGIGKQIQADSSIYIGGWENGKKQGHGKMAISDSEEYEGQFRNGIKWGKGKQKFKNKDNYVGEYAEGKFHGKGIYTWCNFSRYQGSFIEGKRCGHGIWTIDYRNPQADSYQGQYLNDKKHGFGKYHWKDGTTYEGEFQNDLKHGEGVITQPSGKVVRLDWIQGNIVTKRASLEIDESEAVTSINKNQPFKKQQQKNSQKSIKALKLSLKGNRKSNAFVST